MRNLKTRDVFKMSKILKKINVDLDVEDKTQEQMGADLILQISENLYIVEDEINELIGDLIGMTGEEFSELDLLDTVKYFEEFKKLPGVEDFFILAGKQIKNLS